MSGWDPISPKEVTLSFDLEEASSWMEEMDHLDNDTRNELFHKILAIAMQEKDKKPTVTEEEEKVFATGALKKELEDLEHAKDRAIRSDIAIRPSEVAATERDYRDKRVYFYNSDERTSKTCIGWRSFGEWPRIADHMKRSMRPDCSDMDEKIIFWNPID